MLSISPHNFSANKRNLFVSYFLASYQIHALANYGFLIIDYGVFDNFLDYGVVNIKEGGILIG